MLKQSNILEVKHIAKALLYMDFEVGKFGALIVKHPFADSAFTYLRGENGIEMINLLEDEEGLKM